MNKVVGLREARSQAADAALEEMNLAEFAYLGRTGWEDDGCDRLVCKVFLEPIEGRQECSQDMAVGINFEAGSAEVASVEYELPHQEQEVGLAL